MHWGKICALAAVVALTLLTFASCGPLKIKGTDLLMNSIDSGDMAEGMGGMMGGMDVTATKKSESKPIFEGGDRWLHFVYIAMVALGLIGILVKPKLFAGVGALGLILTIVFMFGFDHMFTRESKADATPGEANPFAASISLDWEEGAWIALAGFAGLAAAGFQSKKSGGGGDG